MTQQQFLLSDFGVSWLSRPTNYILKNYLCQEKIALIFWFQPLNKMAIYDLFLPTPN